MDHVYLKNELYLSPDLKAISPETTLSDDKYLIKIADEAFSKAGYFSYLCVICNGPNVLWEKNKGTFCMYMSENKQHIYCFSCWQSILLHHKRPYCLIEKKQRMRELTIGSDTKLANILVKMMLKCKWATCGKIYYYYNLEEHEIKCEHQPKICCPVKFCKFEQQLRYFEEHFKSHPKCKLVFGNRISGAESGTDYYFVFADVVIKVKYTMKETGDDLYKHGIVAKHCAAMCTMKPMVFLNDALGIVEVLEDSGSIYAHTKNVSLAVSFKFP